MKSFSQLIHKTPWWALVIGGFTVLAGLAMFLTPTHLIRLERSGATPEENKAIKREIDYAFTEGAIDFARGVVREMYEHAKDPSRKEELEHAMDELDNARDGLREAGREVLQAKREAVEATVEAATQAREAISEANAEARRALKDAGVDNQRILKSLDDSLQAAKDAEDESKRALEETTKNRTVDKVGRAVESASAAAKGEKPPLATPAVPPISATPAVPPVPAMPSMPTIPKVTIERSNDGQKKRVTIGGIGTDKPLVDIQVDRGSGKGARIEIDPSIRIEPLASVEPPLAPLPPLSPEAKADIREKVTGDLYRLGVGGGLILIFIPLFILTLVAKFFIDRSRASMRLVELKKKEADFHSMSRQVTEAKLQALQAQVEPHFLYNTLASVQALTEVDPAQANLMTGHLIAYLRNALPKMRESVSTVGQEIELVRAYLNILQMRMGKRLTFDITVPQSLLALPFPPLMVPSLVENAIKHGLEPQREGGSVLISAQSQDGKLRLTVADTGRGFGESIGAGVGLTNIRERLAALYGDQAKLTLEENAPHGVIATLEVPLGVSANTTMTPPIPVAPLPASAATPPTFARKTLSVAAGAERVWRKTLSFTFIALVIVAAVFCGLVLFGGMTGLIPVQIGDLRINGAEGALLSGVAMVVVFILLVIVAALLIAILYGLGFLAVGLAIFIPIVIVIALMPVMAPFILLALLIWWFFRKKKAKAEDAVPLKVEPMFAETPPPVPTETETRL
jgi:Histidine kinase